MVLAERMPLPTLHDRRRSLRELLESHPELRIEQDQYNINVTANFGQTLTPTEIFARIEGHEGADLPGHLYFHIPLCSYICHFCNYVKTRLTTGDRAEETLDEWVALLVQESNAYLRTTGWLPTMRVESLFLGGGTAALLRPRHLAMLLQHVRDNYSLTEDCELTLEGNPDNFTSEYVLEARSLGFNRFSVGVQSFQDDVTRFTGREHDRAASLRAIETLLDTGCPFNVDLMFGLPFQTVKTAEEDIRLLVERNVPTITIYRLRNVDRQMMGIGNRAAWNVPKIRDRLHAGGLFPPLNETYAMREAVVEVLIEKGYNPSPCGWWSAPDTYPEGNIPRVSKNKWERNDTMIAFGPGAYGWISGGQSHVVQTHNDADIASYARRIRQGDVRPLAFGRLLTGNQALGSVLGFAFKANQPISIDRFRRQFGTDILKDEPCRGVFEDLLQKELIELVADGTALKPTLDGEALHEEIISVYLHDRIGQYSDATCRRS